MNDTSLLAVFLLLLENGLQKLFHLFCAYSPCHWCFPCRLFSALFGPSLSNPLTSILFLFSLIYCCQSLLHVLPLSFHFYTLQDVLHSSVISDGFILPLLMFNKDLTIILWATLCLFFCFLTNTIFQSYVIAALQVGWFLDYFPFSSKLVLRVFTEKWSIC